MLGYRHKVYGFKTPLFCRSYGMFWFPRAGVTQLIAWPTQGENRKRFSSQLHVKPAASVLERTIPFAVCISKWLSVSLMVFFSFGISEVIPIIIEGRAIPLLRLSDRFRRRYMCIFLDWRVTFEELTLHVVVSSLDLGDLLLEFQCGVSRNFFSGLCPVCAQILPWALARWDICRSFLPFSLTFWQGAPL